MSLPARPFDIGHDVTLVELAECYRELRSRLYRHRDGGEPMPTADFASAALAALACGHVLAERAAAGRWCHAVDALAAGATHEQVAVAMGIATPEDMRIGLAVWVSEQRHHGLIDDDRHDWIRELIGEEQG